ncbi:MAG: hypothetical protein WA139_03375 [Candidatus Aenigmatarchaeota archaeon]
MPKETIYHRNEITDFGNELTFCAAEGCPNAIECAAIGEYICENNKR